MALIPMLKETYYVITQGPANRELQRRITAINQHRLTWVLSIFLFVHAAHIALFWPYTPVAVTAKEHWRNEVILVHATLLAVITLLLPAKYLLERYGRNASAVLNGIPEWVGMLYLLAGAGLAIVDQRVTPSINALVVSAIGVGLVIVTRPVVALFQYGCTLLFFLAGVAWIQEDPNLLLTVRVNSITAIGLGFGLTILQWRNGILSLLQQRRINEQHSELEEKNRELTVLATRDPLTGLLNRAQFSKVVNKEVYRLRGTEIPACLVMMDVDYFKSINDTYGHPVGDSILVELAGLLTRRLRSIDIVGRFGGEEFAILLPGSSVAEGVHLAEGLRAAIYQRSFGLGQPISITASFGVAPLATEFSDALGQTYRAADQALYKAKHDGRNCVRYQDERAADHRKGERAESF